MIVDAVVTESLRMYSLGKEVNQEIADLQDLAKSNGPVPCGQERGPALSNQAI